MYGDRGPQDAELQAPRNSKLVDPLFLNRTRSLFGLQIVTGCNRPGTNKDGCAPMILPGRDIRGKKTAMVSRSRLRA
jgi:hypothetical protein